MALIDKLLEKLYRCSIHKKEMETLLKRLGFLRTRGKGSHEVWKHPELSGAIILATHSKEVKRYQIKQVELFLREGGLVP